MSFSGKVKEELLEHYARARHCDIAELSAIVHMAGEFKVGHGGVCCLKVHTENLGVARKCFTLLVKTFNIKTDVVVRRNTGKDNYSYYIYAKGEELLAIRDTIVQAVCCKRAYIRGAFIASGSMSDPSKSYHFEIVCNDENQAEHLKEMRNSVNRKVNCETANINKTVSAAVRQMEDITYIRDQIGFDKLPEGLRDVALTRLAYPEAALKELGQLMASPLGKSGVNHRLRKLSEIAQGLREQQGGASRYD